MMNRKKDHTVEQLLNQITHRKAKKVVHKLVSKEVIRFVQSVGIWLMRNMSLVMASIAVAGFVFSSPPSFN